VGHGPETLCLSVSVVWRAGSGLAGDAGRRTDSWFTDSWFGEFGHFIRFDDGGIIRFADYDGNKRVDRKQLANYVLSKFIDRARRPPLLDLPRRRSPDGIVGDLIFRFDLHSLI